MVHTYWRVESSERKFPSFPADHLLTSASRVLANLCQQEKNQGVNYQLIEEVTTFNNNGRHGLAADYYIDIFLSKCSADNNKTNGFFMNHSCISSNISNCTANNNGGCGILIQGKSKCKKITSVTTNSNKSMGISLRKNSQ